VADARDSVLAPQSKPIISYQKASPMRHCIIAFPS
jgi:hypothetical protein